MLSLYTGLAFAQQGESSVAIELTGIRPDSLWVSKNGDVYFVKPDKDNKYILHFKHGKPFEVKVGFDRPKKGVQLSFWKKATTYRWFLISIK